MRHGLVRQQQTAREGDRYDGPLLAVRVQPLHLASHLGAHLLGRATDGVRHGIMPARHLAICQTSARQKAPRVSAQRLRCPVSEVCAQWAACRQQRCCRGWEGLQIEAEARRDGVLHVCQTLLRAIGLHRLPAALHAMAMESTRVPIAFACRHGQYVLEEWLNLADESLCRLTQSAHSLDCC